MKDGTTQLAYKPEHAVDMDTGAVVAAELHPADEGDTTTLSSGRHSPTTTRSSVWSAPSCSSKTTNGPFSAPGT